MTTDEAETIRALSVAYECLADSGAPDDVQRALLCHLRRALRVPGDPDVLIEQALTEGEVRSIGRKGG